MRKVVVLACILSLLIPVAVLVGCGGSAQTPAQVTEAFFAALKKRDVNTTWNMMAAASRQQVGSKSTWESALKDPSTAIGDIKVKLGKTTVNDNNATVEVTSTTGGKASTETVPLVKENGVWKVDIAKSSAAQ
jgi:hypothetical protein